jgi:signal transduction histidine kinase
MKSLTRLKKKPEYLLISKKMFEITDYAFSEILNNALEHSGSDTIDVKCKRTNKSVDIIDRGIGIYNNIMKI